MRINPCTHQFALVFVLITAGCATQSAARTETSTADQATPSTVPTETSIEQPPAATPEASVETKEINYQVGAAKMTGFIAYPATQEKRPAVLVVHEWWGHNDYVRMRARKLAEMGYVGFAIDMYGDGKLATHPDEAKKFMTEVMSNMPEGVKRFEAAKNLLASDPRVQSDKIAAIGYCFGGAVVLNMARGGADLDLVGSFHGMLGTDKPLKPGAFAGEIFVAHGGADPFIPQEQLDAFKKEMEKAKAHHKLVIYDGAKHGFTNPAATEAGKRFSMPVEYDAAADTASWQKLSELLAKVWAK